MKRERGMTGNAARLHVGGGACRTAMAAPARINMKNDRPRQFSVSGYPGTRQMKLRKPCPAGVHRN